MRRSYARAFSSRNVAARARVRRRLSPARVLALGGLISGIIGTISGIAGSPIGLGIASGVMLAANVCALVIGECEP